MDDTAGTKGSEDVGAAGGTGDGGAAMPGNSGDTNVQDSPPIAPAEQVSNIAEFGDVVKGGVFNKTRQIRKFASTMITDIPGQCDFRIGAADAAAGLHRSALGSQSAIVRKSHGNMTTEPVAFKSNEDFLSALLPTPTFASSPKASIGAFRNSFRNSRPDASRFASAISDAPSLGLEVGAAVGTDQLDHLERTSRQSHLSPKPSLTSTVQHGDGHVALPSIVDEQAAADGDAEEIDEDAGDELRGSPADSEEGVTGLEDTTALGARTKNLLTTFRFDEVTADGGVAITFDSLEGSFSEQHLEELHNALEQLIEENEGTDEALEVEIEQEINMLGNMHESMRGEGGAELQSIIKMVGSLHVGDDIFATLQQPAEGPSLDVVEEEDEEISETSSMQHLAAVGGKGARDAKEFSFAHMAAANKLALPGLSGIDEAGGESVLPPQVAAVTAGEEVPPTPSAHAPASAMPAKRVVTPPGQGDEELPSPSGRKRAVKPPAFQGKEGDLKPGTPTLQTRPSITASLSRDGRSESISRQDRHTSLQVKLTELRQHLTSTIQLGFQKGRFQKLNIAILVVGTRGDVQPFIGIGLELKKYGHRVRLASHSVYREFVTSLGLEFYPLGGDPAVLSEYVVKHRGILPGFDISDALEQREQVRHILYSTWGACTEPDPEHPDKVFIADAIIANPPSYGSVHCAEKLSVPFHIVFTMPWTPTKAFPQPFARIKTNLKGNNSKARELMNWMSYFAMEDLAWLGQAGMQKDFRQRVLGIPTWNKFCTSHGLYYSNVPMTYIWSPSLVTRPVDWPAHCEVVGFCTVELKKLTAYEPPKELQDFLDSGPLPVYIGFGSLVVDQPEQLTNSFLAALKRTGLRAIIQRGWGGLGAAYGQQKNGKPGKIAPENVLFIDSVPHDWLFNHVCAVVHHGGAGTTAAGLLAGKPTFIVPFFGDQPFWGAACEQAGVGPAPCPIDDLNTNKIVDALKELILPTRQKAAQELATRMNAENGVTAAVDHIHRNIYGCLLGKRTPVWMKNKKKDGIPAGGAHTGPSTHIKEVELQSGEGFLTGILKLPGRLIRAVTSSGAAPRNADQNGGGKVATSCSAEARGRPLVDVADASSRRGFWSFLGC